MIFDRKIIPRSLVAPNLDRRLDVAFSEYTTDYLSADVVQLSEQKSHFAKLCVNRALETADTLTLYNAHATIGAVTYSNVEDPVTKIKYKNFVHNVSTKIHTEINDRVDAHDNIRNSLGPQHYITYDGRYEDDRGQKVQVSQMQLPLTDNTPVSLLSIVQANEGMDTSFVVSLNPLSILPKTRGYSSAKTGLKLLRW